MLDLHLVNVVVINFANLVHTGRHIDDARLTLSRTGGPQLGQQQMRQQKVAVIVDGHVRFVAFVGQLKRHAHNTG